MRLRRAWRGGTQPHALPFHTSGGRTENPYPASSPGSLLAAVFVAPSHHHPAPVLRQAPHHFVANACEQQEEECCL